MPPSASPQAATGDTLRARAEALRALHQGPRTLLLPNAWDPGSAVLLAQAGFPALATTSAGVAFAQGLPDGERISRDRMLALVGEITARVHAPVTADLEAGYGEQPAAVADTVRGAIAAGAVGLNIEDATASSHPGLLAFDVSVARIAAAREAARQADVPMVINARTDGFLLGGNDQATFDDAVRRGNAYLAAGADCVFVPGTFDLEVIARLVRALDGPLNVLGAVGGRGGNSLAALQEIGVARVSIGSSLALAALGVVQRAAEEMAGAGTFTYAEGAPAHRQLNKLMDT